MEENLWDSKTKYYILPNGKYDADELTDTGMCVTVILYFYYIESVDHYIGYIQNIPSFFKIEIYSPKSEILDKLKVFFTSKGNIHYHLKKNKGRDISTLLVAAKDLVINSDYVCFVHDKSMNAEYLKEDTDRWIDNLWGNMLSNAYYISHIITLFEREKDLGVLFPPSPIGEYLFHWYGDTWLDNYDNTCQLAKELDLSTEIRKEEMPVGMGTVFWARGKALEKLYSFDWNYEVFPEEPLVADGTLNHAVERVIEFVARDMGYRCACILTGDYASWLLSKTQEYARVMFLQLQKRENVFNINQIKNLDRREKELTEYVKNHEKNYVYGAGNYGRALYEFLKKRDIIIDGFLVTESGKTRRMFCGVPVKEIEDMVSERNVGIIIGVSYETRSVIEKQLKQNGFHEYIYEF